MSPDLKKVNTHSDRGFDIVYWLWVLMLFLPERLIAYYIPPLLRIRSLPTLLLLLALFFWWHSDREKFKFKWLGLFLISLFISTLFAENTGRARLVFRLVLEYYFLARISFTFIDNQYKTQKMLYLFALQFLYLGIWGMIGFLQTGRGLITWDYILNEEDAFGPLMGIGVAYCYQYYRAQEKGRSKTIALLATLICVVGVILSFARGTFLVLICTMFYFLIKSGNFLKGLLVIGFAAVVILAATSLIFPENAFWKEMQTSTEGISTGTGRDRKVLWSLAWEEYKDNPVLGVGPSNFGVSAARYLHLVKDPGNYRSDTIWGRALHNAYFQILSELGSFGLVIFLMILFDFNKTNRESLSYRTNIKDGSSTVTENNGTKQLILGIRIAMLAFLLNAFFYDIIYYSWFWILLIYNRMLHINITKRKMLDNLMAAKSSLQ